ncbi:phosphohydrolase [Alkalihalophilus pseudofirmus OF4]|uniref:Phosphohydrolase n=1 Tax=Alkalihalophilus pseudofirmus (strain ATCC BAA-2126 / JCM 17055 / OF4) TaxID=398511 RepID=D3FQP9_ALKPO|nr:metallophosphoesterase [Alkalihalophilus pseudofirmus]ADC51419.1 phosphohydrolase [Alkalihalophilus pseudofirmus OF4]
MTKRIIKRLTISILTALLILFFFQFQNNSITTTDIHIDSDKIPAEFHGYTIVQLSDLHNKSFGKGQRRLLDKVDESKPDLIVFTGDLIDSKNYDEEASLLLMQELVRRAPVYFVTGNHEWWAGTFSSLEEKLGDLGVIVMRNTAAEITQGTHSIQILGVDDPAISPHEEKEVLTRGIEQALSNAPDENAFTILLSHRPEWLTFYAAYPIDLVFSGHAHGGQLRLPFIGGLVAPSQGMLPNYTDGTYTLNETTMIVNRGLGNSIIPLRLFNRPEMIEVKLNSVKNE